MACLAQSPDVCRHTGKSRVVIMPLPNADINDDGDFEDPGPGDEEPQLGNGWGRPASIPTSAFADVRRWHGQGFGCRRTARLLEGIGVFTSKSSVERLLRGKAPYAPG